MRMSRQSHRLARVSPRTSQGSTANDTGDITKEEFEALANFRYAIRRFLRFSEQAARKAGITPQQYQLLLAIKGFPERDYASVSELTERLQLQQHSAVGLIDRTEALGLVRREQGQPPDRRLVFVHLTTAGEELLRRLAALHRQELRNLHIALGTDEDHEIGRLAETPPAQ